MLFNRFNWQFPLVPEEWVGPIIVIFMFLTALIVYKALVIYSEKRISKDDLFDKFILEAKQKFSFPGATLHYSINEDDVEFKCEINNKIYIIYLKKNIIYRNYKDAMKLLTKKVNEWSKDE